MIHEFIFSTTHKETGKPLRELKRVFYETMEEAVTTCQCLYPLMYSYISITKGRSFNDFDELIEKRTDYKNS